MPRSQIPVRLDGARTSGTASGGTPGGLVTGVPDDGGAGGGAGARGTGVVTTGVASSAGQPNLEANAVARSPPAACQPTIASTLLVTSAGPNSTGGSRARTLAATPTLRNWSAAVLATAIDIGSLAAAPITSVSVWPSLLMRPRVVSGGAGGVLPTGSGGGGTGDSVGVRSTW